MEHSRVSFRSHFLVLVILARLALSFSAYPPVPSPSTQPPSAYPPAPAPAAPPISWNPSPAPSSEWYAPSPPLPPPPTVSPSPGEASDGRDDGSVPSSRKPGEGGEHGRSSGMSRGQKAGIVVVVVVVAVVAVVVGLVYKKRRENVRRAEYSYAVRRDIL